MDKMTTKENNATGNLHNPPVIGSFRKRTFIEVFCAKCGERYSDGCEYEKVFTDKADAIETITDEDNWIVKGTNAFCDNCQ